ncbi:putative L-ascorbate peroxidase 6 isoform X3 [Physcomitrium patens]|uniref:putative L-ascorbate peroxidase 6 isoform X3 n=1 Tax=Physcomitrium patens TaxID=3218 RepID=UPI000D16188E|nr:putative L-ascorbate peroxidase 6 isoform X3 [Physcomitrium patens]|eukprot:XP_024401301.1 putative L-ascorbate peroxidase 6 isoform X3 [Physcomitrella patens]
MALSCGSISTSSSLCCLSPIACTPPASLACHFPLRGGYLQLESRHLASSLGGSSGFRNRKLSANCYGSGIRASLDNSSPGPDEDKNVSRRQALLAVLAFTIPGSQVFQPQRFPQALAVEDEQMKIELIQRELKKVLSKGKSAGVLRLSFHDAGTFDSSDNSGGMNGSLLFELERPESAGLQRPIKVLQKAKKEIELAFPVSWADLIAVAGAAAVLECDGPVIPVRLGRLDASGPDPEGKMPEETLTASELKRTFQSKGFSTQEMVALSGAHTIGNKGFGNPNLFDNSYFQILLQKPWKIGGPDDGMTSMIGLATDRALADDEECLEWVRVYAADQGRFFTDFSAVYTKLVNTGARWTPPQA